MNDLATPSRPRVATLGTRLRRYRLPLAVAAALSLLAATGFALWGGEIGPPPVSVVAERGDVEETVTALGNLQPRDYVDVGAQVSGQLKTIAVEIGDTVKQGDLLAEIDARVQQAKVEASRAQLQNLKAQLVERQAQLELSRQQYQRQHNLREEDATSEDAYQVAKATLRAGEAQIEALKAQIQQTESTIRGDETTLGYTKIYAPMNGTVVQLLAKQGQTLNANQTAPIILRIADLSTMTVWTQVSEADVAKLRIGMDAYFTTLGDSRRRWTGKLRQILPTPEVLNNVVLYTALFEVDNPRGDLMTQMSAQVFFVAAAAHDVVTVPVTALKPLKPRERSYQVTVVDERGREQLREVNVGVTNRVTAEILAGLEPGERVLTHELTAAPSSSSQPGRRPGGGLRGFR